MPGPRSGPDQRRPVDAAAKRILDAAAAAILMVATLPLTVPIALAVSVSSPGGVFFRQVRVGRERKPFRIWKFRTMAVQPGTERGSFDLGSARRVTAVGRWLRATKLDELPQLINVLVGEMSLVGPRPEVPAWTEVHRELWEVVLSVRPGITDPASIEFRDEERVLAAASDPEACYRDEILPRKLALSARYVQERTVWLDLRILARTAVAVLARRP